MRTISLVIAIMLAAALAGPAQTKPVTTETTYGSCSPNMSHNSGSIVINCKGLDPVVAAQITELVSQISILNKTTATAKNQQLMMKILKDLQATVEEASRNSGSSNTANPGVTTAPVRVEPCGVFQNGGSNNSASPTCAPPERHLTDTQKKAISDALTGKQITVHVGYMVNVPDAQDYANELCDAIKEGMPATDCSETWAMAQERRSLPWYGVSFTYNGNPVPQGTTVSLPPDNPATILMRALLAAGLNKGMTHADPTMKDNEVTLVVGPPPKD